MVFAIISLVAGVALLAFWTFMLMMTIAIQQMGGSLNPEGEVIFYTLLSIGMVLIFVAIILFILRAKRKDET